MRTSLVIAAGLIVMAAMVVVAPRCKDHEGIRVGNMLLAGCR
jgi:hypothetical protein